VAIVIAMFSPVRPAISGPVMTGAGSRAARRARPDLYFYRPDLDPANARVRSWVYLLCLDPPYKHARHYAGYARVLPVRLAQHGTSNGARLLEVQRQAGGSWHIARTWPGGYWEEQGIKQWRQGPMLCPDCTPGNRRGSMADLARAAQRARTRAAERTEERDRARAARPASGDRSRRPGH